MTKKIIILIIFIMAVNITGLSAENIAVSGSVFCGYMPSMGGNLYSYTQETYFGSNSGIDGINRSMDGYSTSKIDRLAGIDFGLELKTIFYDYFLVRIGANYGMSVLGGKGKTVYFDGTSYNTLKCEYSFNEYDFPVTFGISIPFWKDGRIAVSCGLSFAHAEYKNKFTSDSTAAPFSATQNTIKGKFSGWAFPIVAMMQADYNIRADLSLYSAILYYRGETKVLKDREVSDGNIDFAKIDFTGYRLNMGVSYNFYLK